MHRGHLPERDLRDRGLVFESRPDCSPLPALYVQRRGVCLSELSNLERRRSQLVEVADVKASGIPKPLQSLYCRRNRDPRAIHVVVRCISIIQKNLDASIKVQKAQGNGWRIGLHFISTSSRRIAGSDVAQDRYTRL